jgi:hypothetical protein
MKEGGREGEKEEGRERKASFIMLFHDLHL